MKRFHVFVLLVIAYAALVVAHTRVRVIDGDEGYYASAARLVGEGGIPYMDFFYPQAPILPFVYGAWTKLDSYSLAWLRILSALLTTGSVGLWAWFLFKEYDIYPWVSLTAFLVFLFNPFLLSWGVVVKTFALGNFLATVTLICIWKAGLTRNAVWLLAAGISCGLLVSTRLLYAAVPICIASWLFIRIRIFSGLQPCSSFLIFVAGIAIACVPALLLCMHDPNAFMFNNIGYHLLRSETPSPLIHFQQAMSFLRDTVFVHPYMILLLVLAAIGAYDLVAGAVRRRGGNGFVGEVALVSTIALIVTSLTPLPLYEQYLTSPLAPLMVPLVAVGIQLLWSKNRFVVFALMPIIVAFSISEFQHEKRPASSIRGWQLSTLDGVSRYIRNNTSESDTVISPWPGYACESGRRFMPAFENQFGILVSEQLTEAQRQHYHVAGKSAFISAIRSKLPKMVIIGAWVSPLFVTLNDTDREELYQSLDQQYRLATQIEDVYVYERRR